MSLVTFLTAPVVAEAQLPTAAFVPDPAFGVIGSVVKLDGRLSSDPDQKPLTYTWRFISVPIGSQVQGEGFRALDLDSVTGSPDVVSFSPDVVGEYVVGLVVSNGVFESVEVANPISIRAILVPHGRGIIPDGKFIWSFIRDMWTQVDGKEFFETLWSALIQITGSELLKLYQVDFNKSIRDIQDRFQRRWLAYEPKLLLTQDDLTIYLGYSAAGDTASTINLGLEGQAVILSSNEVIVVVGARLQNVTGETLTILYSGDPGNIGSFTLQGLNSGRNGYKLTSPSLNPVPDTIAAAVPWTFALGSTTWTLAAIAPNSMALTLSEWAPFSDTLLKLFNQTTDLASLYQVGDVIHYPTGPNAGFYRILAKSGIQVTVDHAPPGASVAGSPYLSVIYRPVGFKVTQPAIATTDTFAVPYVSGSDISVLAPGRIIVVNGQSFTIVRSVIDMNQTTPVVVVTVDTPDLLYGLRSLVWRAPNTLLSSSQNFEDLGIATGDLIGFDVVHVESGTTSEVVGQVVGIHGKALGFVLTDGEVKVGVVPPVPDATIQKLASDFGIEGVSVSPSTGELVFTGTALDFYNSLNSGVFKRAYWNQPLTASSNIQVNPLFQIKPKYVIRNRLIPVDAELRSVPALQEWVVQPTLTERGGIFYQVVRGKEFQLKRKPVALSENVEYLVDNEFAFNGLLTINTGSNEVEAENADFVDRSMVPGDKFVIDAPITLAGTYTIEKVISNSKVRLTKPVPAYVLGTYATVKASLQRKKTGHFLRFVPGLFTAQKPAPDRLWAEVSFFDNSQTIEDNFGILVGLTKASLEMASKDISYRQAVAGLMFAYTRGSAIDKVRLGAQILLGLPFAEHRGIVRSIEADYRLDASGNPILGRILVEDIDETGKPLGTLRIYTYPIDPVSALAGLDVNPATGKLYQVGDTVELFAPLSKGVEVMDYLTDPLNASFSSIYQLQQFHSVRLRANDNIFSLNELGLVSDFLRKITPSYLSYALIIDSEFADVVQIQDVLFNRLRAEGLLIDNASLGIPATLMLDSRSADGVPQININGGVYSVRRVGYDLATTAGSSNVTSVAAGFINPKANEVFEPPLSLAGDFLVIFDGINKGTYGIGTVVSDSNVLLTTGAPAMGFAAATGQFFAIVRKLPAPFVSGNANVANGNPTVVLAGVPQLRSRGVAPGDWIILQNGAATLRRLIIDVKESAPGSGIWNTVDVTPAPNFTNAATPYSIFRPALLTGGSYSVTSLGTPFLSAVANPELYGLVSIGDELVLNTPTQERLTVLDNATLYAVPALPAGVYTVSIAFKNRASTIVGWDHIEKYDPIDAAEIELVEDQLLANCLASDVVALQMQRTTAPAGAPVVFDPQAAGVMPGDLLVITSGANSLVDNGQGPGVYPIVAVTALNVQISVPFLNVEMTSWKIIRRR